MNHRVVEHWENVKLKCSKISTFQNYDAGKITRFTVWLTVVMHNNKQFISWNTISRQLLLTHNISSGITTTLRHASISMSCNTLD